VFSNDGENVNYPVIVADTSTAKGRFNCFDIVENDTTDLTNGVVRLTSGYYNYEIYEQTSSTNLDPALADNLVEIGKARVVDNTVETYNGYDDCPDTVVFYDPDAVAVDLAIPDMAIGTTFEVR